MALPFSTTNVKLMC